jgi:hypothetical protein
MAGPLSNVHKLVLSTKLPLSAFGAIEDELAIRHG